MAKQFVLTASVVSPADVARLKRNLEDYADQLQQVELEAKSGAAAPTAEPRPSRPLNDMATSNGLNLTKAADRQSLLTVLETLLKRAPTITMSFAVDPSAAFMAKVVTWLRREIHPELLVRVGLQPSIAAGCVVRTPSKFYDFSLHDKFSQQREMLLSRLKDPAPTAEAATKTPAEPALAEAAK